MENIRFHTLMSGLFANSHPLPGLTLAASFFLTGMDANANSHARPLTEKTERVASVFTIDGIYGFDEGGEMYFSPSETARQSLPHYPGNDKVDIGFSNPDSAISMFGLREDIRKIDLQTICAVRGQARITASHILYGKGPAHSWYTMKLERVIRRSPAQLLPCTPDR